MAVAAVSQDVSAAAPVRKRRTTHASYPNWFYLPAAIIYGVLFLVPTVASFFFSMTRWTLSQATYIGFDNFVEFFSEPFLVQGLVNTLIYGALTSALKVVLGLLLAVLLTSDIIGRSYLRAVVFFPVLVSTVGVTLPLMRPATVTVIILSLIGGLRSFDLIWAMTRGGPGFTSDVIASVIYKQYQAGFYGLSTAGNVVLFAVVAAIIVPLSWWLNRDEVER